MMMVLVVFGRRDMRILPNLGKLSPYNGLSAIAFTSSGTSEGNDSFEDVHYPMRILKHFISRLLLYDREMNAGVGRPFV